MYKTIAIGLLLIGLIGCVQLNGEPVKPDWAIQMHADEYTNEKIRCLEEHVKQTNNLFAQRFWAMDNNFDLKDQDVRTELALLEDKYDKCIQEATSRYEKGIGLNS